MSRLTLSRAVSLAVLTRATTEADHHEDLGCSILGPPSRPVRRGFAWLQQQLARMPVADARKQARGLIDAMEARPAWAALCEAGRKRQGRRVLKASVLFPDPAKTPPRVLHLRRGALGLDVPVARADWPMVNRLFATLAQGATRAELTQLGRHHATVAELIDALTEARWLERWAPPPAHAVARFIGHNTTLVRSPSGVSVLVDPYFRPADALDLPNFQPMQPRDLGRVDAVLITHSHGDHFHLGSLLQLPPETRFFVPPVERENLFSTDMALRLRQLGFQHVEALPWWAARQVGDVTVQALPFYGEQPTDQRGLYPGLRNVGSTWKVSTPTHRFAFFADAGHDVEGDMKDVCRRAGPVDALFCGVRGFKLQPLFFGATTLSAFLVDVPASLLTTPQQLMADGPQALDYAKRLGASALVPCADGGAPWYWREGMGPRYPGYPGEPVLGASRVDENPDADPFPERIVAKKGQPAVKLLRPGQDFAGEAPAPFVWPFGSAPV